jgi:hypothetical protein
MKIVPFDQDSWAQDYSTGTLHFPHLPHGASNSPGTFMAVLAKQRTVRSTSRVAGSTAPTTSGAVEPDRLSRAGARPHVRPRRPATRAGRVIRQRAAAGDRAGPVRSPAAVKRPDGSGILPPQIAQAKVWAALDRGYGGCAAAPAYFTALTTISDGRITPGRRRGAEPRR